MNFSYPHHIENCLKDLVEKCALRFIKWDQTIDNFPTLWNSYIQNGKVLEHTNVRGWKYCKRILTGRKVDSPFFFASTCKCEKRNICLLIYGARLQAVDVIIIVGGAMLDSRYAARCGSCMKWIIDDRHTYTTITSYQSLIQNLCANSHVVTINKLNIDVIFLLSSIYWKL